MKMENVKLPTGENYDPGVQVKKALKPSIADTPEKIVKNII